jgi:mono/diheme cytochrome c family protein
VRRRVLSWMLIAIPGSLLGLCGCSFLRGYTEGPSTSFASYESPSLPVPLRGAARLLFDDFGSINTDTLETNAVPWKLVAAALVSHEFPGQSPTQAHLRAILSSYGFIYPQSVGNWPGADQPEFRLPLGLISGELRRAVPRVRVEVANLSCASCHGGVTYDATGDPQPVVWLGLPNTSLDLDAYIDGVLGALRAAVKDRDTTFAAIQALFPEVSADELKTLGRFVWPRLVARLAQGTDGLPFRNGGPGRSNGVEALKFQFGLPAGSHPTAAAVSMPYIGEQRLRWSLLADGIYKRQGDPRFGPRSLAAAAAPAATAEMVSFVTVPTMGLRPDKAVKTVGPMSDVLVYMAGYEPPKFPGAIDTAAANRGAALYARCARCHGEFEQRGGRLRLSSFPNRLSTPGEIGTDVARLDAVNPAVIAAVARTPSARYIDAAETRGYVAPALVGLWATAPYLHNGSVPTLAALMSPGQRPARFWVGGHRLDFVKLGIDGAPDASGDYAYPAAYLPWSKPRMFDTSEPGRSNRGHERDFEGLSAAEKSDLIEFLKEL